ncbi:DUF1800 domain-containing protein [Flavobacterium album]|uniref:DUF1800 domain-containing protein n=1 Tax=Flavobacterium album TaxID=2175091 RepID=A0A2S1QTM0_9FLAO|nr:DUF1800 family protein [Flavobacterium album]AWH83733.1 DUF1800 domain-containing protein [Flavobacterium album]
MDTQTLWSLRLGFNGRHAAKIKNDGIKHFVEQSFAQKPDKTVPAFIANLPKTPDEIKTAGKKLKGNAEAGKKARLEETRVNLELKAWWIDKMRKDEFPLLEKMVLFWHNHFVATFGKIRVNYWVYTHNMVLRENAFGNFRELTKKVLYTNMMIKYLDNSSNIKGKYNENLSRELLELFTIGIGNYTEQDIKNGAMGLAGLTIGDTKAAYRPASENNEPFEYFGKKGNFKADEMVDIIFQQKNAPYHITEKVLKWFIYDNPPQNLVKYYGDYLREQDYEIKPFLLKIFTEEFDKPTAGSKIKDPLVFVLQLLDELDIKEIDSKMVAQFAKGQGMDLFNQPNVKGWNGGTYWLATQIYLQRQNVADLLCKNTIIDKRLLSVFGLDAGAAPKKFNIKLDWDKKGDNKQIIAGLKNRLLFQVDPSLQDDFETMLRYDFNPNAEGAENGVLRLFNFMVKTPEFQLI